MTAGSSSRIPQLSDFSETPALTAGYEALEIQGGRTGVALSPDAISQSLEALAGGFHFGEDDLVQVPDLKRRKELPPHVGKELFMQRDEPFRRSDAEKSGAGRLARQIALEFLVL